MRPEDINKQEIEERVIETLSEMRIGSEDTRFDYLKSYGNTIFLWVLFETDMESITLREMTRIRNRFKNSGFKVASVTAYPKANCQLSFRVVLEF